MLNIMSNPPTWEKILENTISFNSYYKIVPTEGYLAWEYNPLRNYRLSKPMYEKDGKYYTYEELCDKLTDVYGSDVVLTTKSGEYMTEQQILETYNKSVSDEFLLYVLRESGELVDFITDELKFNLSNPVDILPQYSYDGSVNLILNDGLNIPRLINSRFTVTGKNTYKVIDRKGDNDTNIYDLGNLFDVDTSLFKSINKIPKLQYLGTTSGNMKIGNYHFYFKYSDSDGNESDWVAESGLVSVFIGNSPQSVNTGVRDENSIKGVKFILTNIDIGYSYVKVYYTRYSADVDSNLIVEAKKIDKNFIVNSSGTCNILITGDENETVTTIEDINSSFEVIQNAKTQCSAANRLFMANIHKSKIEYEILSKLSLCFCPYKTEEPYPLSGDGLSKNYIINSNSDGYYDSQFIYDKTGYWPGDLYRLGIVYILKDGSLSPVFNIRGATDIPIYNENTLYYAIEKTLAELTDKSDISEALATIDYSEEDFIIIGNLAPNENAKGVILLQHPTSDTIKEPFPILGVQIRADNVVIQELKNYVKGFFFVRLKRMPLTLALGIVVGLDKASRTPTLPTIGGIINSINYQNSFIDTDDIKDINYVSEGFLSRYYWELKEKEVSSWKKFAMIVGAVVIVAALVVATVFTCGAAAAVAAGVSIALASTAGAAMVAGSIGTIAIVAGATIGAGAIAAGIQHGIHDKQVRDNKHVAEKVKGRDEPIPEGYERKELEESRLLKLDLADRVIITDPSKNMDEALIVPDYQVNLAYYNQLFTGDTFTLNHTYELPINSYLYDGYFDNERRHFYILNYEMYSTKRSYTTLLIGVPDSCPIRMIGDKKYRARAGYPEEAYKYEFVGKSYLDNVNKKENSDIIRGNFGSYVGMNGYLGHAVDLVNIMIPGYKENDLFRYVLLRALDTSAFYAISDRIDIYDINKNASILLLNAESTEPYTLTCYRGDCYICQYTHRIIRNFNDPSAPYNNVVVDSKSWKDNYLPDTPEKYSEINLGDVNAIELGLWLTFKLRSSYNLNIRTIDKSNTDEYLMCGNYRSFYPNYSDTLSLKIPDSDLYNKGFSKSVSEKYYFEVPDVPYIKQEFLNRIVFSDIHINDAYKNGFRVLRTMNHKDYPMTYGCITKLIELQNALLVVFEHGVGVITIDNSSEHPSQILSEVKIINDMYGSLWKDSVLKTPSGIYGVDTVAKKIWRVRDGKMEIISDMRVLEFLNQNITLSERETTPIIGVRNVKTVYNAFKHDVMFTFYDNLYGLSEKAWNLCWNELLGIFTTFYSWIPCEMLNIDNIPFSFDRTTVKAISKLGISDHGNDFSDGVTLSNNILRNVTNSGFEISNKSLQVLYLDERGLVLEFDFYKLASNTPNSKKLSFIMENKKNLIGFLHLDNRTLPTGKVYYKIKYELLRDRLENYKLFGISPVTLAVKPVREFGKDTDTTEVTVYYLYLKPNIDCKLLLSEIYYRNKKYHSYADDIVNAVKPSDVVKDENGKVIADVGIKVGMPIFKNKAGKRLTLDEKDQINSGKIVRYLNIKATILIGNDLDNMSASEAYYNSLTTNEDSGMINAGYFESQVAITTDFNLSLLSTDFWKHGLAGLIDITDKIYPTYWYGRQHPFEFECVVVDNPNVHKIFTNLELVANKVKPESFHYEVIGDVYDFADDRPTMYFRQEALKALYQYNGYDIEYNPNFLEVLPIQHARSADFPKYYSRWDTVNEIYDTYKSFESSPGFNYDHLSGAEIVYYPTRNEFRVWNHVKAIDVDEKVLKDGMLIETSILKANCRYLEDKWLVSINPIVVTYKNEFNKALAISNGKSMFHSEGVGVYPYSSWVPSADDSKVLLPPINITGTKLEQKVGKSNIEIPQGDNGKDNALYGLYNTDKWNKGDWSPIDPTKNNDRRETDVRGKFMKVRIRYTGKELAIIDLLNTIYQISYA